MSTYPGEADGHDIDIDYEDCSDELDTEKVSMDYEEYTLARLKGKFKHYCVDWDGLAIDETCVEFEHCLCEFEGKPPRTPRPVEDMSGDDTF